jgi:hypothetical protein
VLDRRTVINLIERINTKSKTDFEITFHFQSEYEALLSLIKGIGLGVI